MTSTNHTGPLVWISILGVTCVLLYLLQSILWLVIPILLAVVLYYLLAPVVRYMTLHGLSMTQAASLVMGTLFIIKLVTMILVFPTLSDRSQTWQLTVTRYLDGGADFLEQTLSACERKFTYLKKIKLNEKITKGLDDFTSHFAENHSGEIMIQLAKWLPSLLLIPYLTFFMLTDGSKLKRFLLQAVPNAFFEKTLLLFYRVDHQLRRYFQGMMALTLLDAVTLALGLAMLGFNSAIILGVATAVLAWLPYIGSLIGCIIVVLVAATDFPTQPWMVYGVLALFIGVRLLDEFIYLPMTVGKSLRVHPVISVLMILIGGAIAGAAGLFLVMPLLGVVMVIGEICGQVLTDKRLLARHVHAKALSDEVARTGLKS